MEQDCPKESCGEQTKLTFIQKGKPHQDGYIERFNRTFREEVLDAYAFDNLRQARAMSQAGCGCTTMNALTVLSDIKPLVQFLLKYGKLHHPKKADAEFTTFQQDGNCDWNFIVSNVTKEG